MKLLAGDFTDEVSAFRARMAEVRNALDVLDRSYSRDGDGQFSSGSGGGSGGDGADAEQSARDRQGAIDKAKLTASASADLDQIAAYEAAPHAYRNRVEQLNKRGALSEHDASEALRMGEAGDHAGVRDLADRLSRNAGMTPIGRTGDTVRFDPAKHQALGDRPRDGATVEVVKRGHDLALDGESIRIAKATVDSA